MIKNRLIRINKVDYQFPEQINIETSSLCNLNCIHCPSHFKKHNKNVRKFGNMEFELFNKIINEIDEYGQRVISLHKDGEPLLNKDICKMLNRVKAKNNHHVYLTTNGILLNDEIIEAILVNNIDIVNISIGADTQSVYKEIRGGNIDIVKNNVNKLIKRRKELASKTVISVQIIKINHKSIKKEISLFKKYWKEKPVVIEIWNELTWGINKLRKNYIFRHPCLSLWKTFNINHNGLVSACCIDWNNSLIIGDVNNNLIKNIWQYQPIKNMRFFHIKSNYKSIKLCENCNYWKWQPRLKKYKIIA